MELFNFFKTISVLITTITTGIVFTLSELNTYTPAQPSELAQPYESAPQTNFKLRPVNPRPINPQAIVGILCKFTNINPESENYKKIKYNRGSGVIINTDGFVLANRSVADPSFYDPENWLDYQLIDCVGGAPPKEYQPPKEEEIKKISPFIQIPVLAYKLEPVFAPFETYISDYEQDWLDFALFAITGLTPDAKSFGVNSLPKPFPYISVLISQVPKINEKFVSFGYPVGTTIGLKASIDTVFIQGLLSHATKLWTGDKRFADELFLIQSQLDTEGTAEGGRFGSPILWKGYLVGTHVFRQDRSLNIYNLGIQPIADILESNGITMFDDVY